jgi:hypothetical protein
MIRSNVQSCDACQTESESVGVGVDDLIFVVLATVSVTRQINAFDGACTVPWATYACQPTTLRRRFLFFGHLNVCTAVRSDHEYERVVSGPYSSGADGFGNLRWARQSPSCRFIVSDYLCSMHS